VAVSSVEPTVTAAEKVPVAAVTVPVAVMLLFTVRAPVMVSPVVSTYPVCAWAEVANAVVALPSNVAASMLVRAEPSPLKEGAETGPVNVPVAAARVPVAVMSLFTVSAPVSVPPARGSLVASLAVTPVRFEPSP